MQACVVICLLPPRVNVIWGVKGHQMRRFTVGFCREVSDSAAVASIDLSQDAGVGCQPIDHTIIKSFL